MLLKYIPVVIFQTAVIMDSFVVANFGSSLSSATAWIAMLESAAMSAEFKDELKVVNVRLPAANAKPITHEIFDQIVPKAQTGLCAFPQMGSAATAPNYNLNHGK